MKKNIDLIIDGVAPEKVMYDTDNHSLVVLYPAQEEFKVGDRVVLKPHSMKNLSSYNGFTYFRDMNTSNGSYIVIKEIKIYDYAEKQTAIYGTNSVTGKRYFYPIEWLEHYNAEFKRGDILTAVGHDKNNMTFIYNHFDKYNGLFEALCGGVQINPATKKSQLRDTWIKYGFNKDKVRHATPSEIEQFDNDLKSIGKRWNRDTLEIENIKPEFKRGDIVFHEGRIMIVKRYPSVYDVMICPFIDDALIYDVAYGVDFTAPSFRLATPEEQQVLFDALAKEGKKWNAETLQIEPIVKFKAGDKVRFKKGLILEVDKRYNGLIYPMEIHNTREDILEVLDDDNFGRVRCFNPKNIDWWSYLPEWLEHVVKDEVKFKKGDIVYHNNMVSIFDTYTNSAYEFHGLYNVLIDGSPWHIGKFNNQGVRIATTTEQQILFDALKEKGKRWNAKTLEVEDLVKKGDIVIHDNTKRISIFDSYKTKYSDFKAIFSIDRAGDIVYNQLFNTDTLRCATSSEIEKFDNDLKEISKKWNRETLEIEDIIPEFKKGDILASKNILLIFDKYANKERDVLRSFWNNITKYDRDWKSERFTYATDEQIAQLHKELKKDGKRWNAETLEIEDLDISEIVVDLPTACEYLKEPMPKNYVYEPNSDFEKQINAQIELQMIRKAWNKFDGFVVDFKDDSQARYYLEMKYDSNGTKVLTKDCYRTYANMDTSCYSFKSRERALQFGKQFKELFKTAMGR